MWLPDDEDSAVELAELLLAHGADATHRDPQGLNAKDRARQRALDRVARVLTAPR
jgi:hypothetical protein